jgi:hypothetical protein
VYAPKERHNQPNTFLFSHLLVLLVLLSCSAGLCCFEEKSNRFSLTRQGLSLFHTSHQVFVRTYFGDSAGEDIHVLIIAPCFAK